MRTTTFQGNGRQEGLIHGEDCFAFRGVVCGVELRFKSHWWSGKGRAACLLDPSSPGSVNVLVFATATLTKGFLPRTDNACRRIQPPILLLFVPTLDPWWDS
ncbi:hypothetical protein QOT17_002174 [Balamuthia mandrillaris]